MTRLSLDAAAAAGATTAAATTAAAAAKAAAAATGGNVRIVATRTAFKRGQHAAVTTPKRNGARGIGVEVGQIQELEYQVGLIGGRAERKDRSTGRDAQDEVRAAALEYEPAGTHADHSHHGFSQ